jgi:hypothetical protein
MKARLWPLLATLALAAAGQSLPARWRQWSLPPLDRVAPLHNRDLNWFGLQFHFLEGELTLSAPVEGVVATAVFTGAGELTVLPPDAAEAGQMLRFSRHAPLHETFSAVVFRLADSAAFLRQFTPELNFAAGVGRGAAEALQQRADHANDVRSPEIARLWLALAAPAPRTWLLAGIKPTSGGWLTAEFDPARPAPLRVLRLRKEGAPEVWTAFRPANAPPRASLPAIESYQLTADLANHMAIDGGARLTLRAPAAVPGLLLRRDPDLHLVSAIDQTGAAEWLQPDGAGWAYVALPVAAGEAKTINLRYHGSPPMAPAGDGGIVTGDWYPQLWESFDPPPARWDLRFGPQRRYQILASPHQSLPQAGFAAAPGQTSTSRLPLASGGRVSLTMLVPGDKKAQLLAPLAGARLLDIFNFLGARFGPYPYPAVGLWLDGPVGGVDPPVPGVVAFSGADTSLQAAQAAAGQWWGAWTRPAGPGDIWLTQGLRAASGLLYAIARDGPDSVLPALRSWQQLIARAGGRGPMTLGPERLGPGEAALLPEIKGAYAIYMLHGMMFDASAPAPDAAFDALLEDFARQYGGKLVTARQFEALAERHMTPAMDLDRNHSLAWFFQPLLAGVSLPVLHFRADAAPVDKSGGVQLTFTVDNPEGWRGLLPVYVFRDRDHYVRGLVPVTQARNTMTIAVPFSPEYVEANHFLDMLVEVKQ